MRLPSRLTWILVLLGALALIAVYQIAQQPIALPAEGVDIKDIASDSTDVPATAVVPSTTDFTFEIKDTPQGRQQGLSNRESVPSGYGMLFVFAKYGQYGFWMKDMLVPIDILWLSDTGEVLGVEESVAPETYPRVFYPPQPVRLVLETRAGESRAQGWIVGEHVPLPLRFE